MSFRSTALLVAMGIGVAACADDDATTSAGGGGASGATTGAGGQADTTSNGPGAGGEASTSTSDVTSTSVGGGASTSNASTGGSGPGAGGGGTGGGGTGGGGTGGGGTGGGGPATPIKNVFLIAMENHDWSEIEGNDSAPYINGTLVPMAARASAYTTPPDLHPSEPNYIWVEAGSNLGIDNDDPPADNMQSTTAHLVTQLEAAGISWKSYAQGIDGTTCPLEDDGLYAPRHVPQLFFSDITDGGSADSQHCIDHVRPYEELSADLASGDVPRYAFITPDLCNDMHGEAFGLDCNMFLDDLIGYGDTFLSEVIPIIMGSAAYQDGGLIIVWWDEGSESLSGASDGPLPFFVISANAKPGYTGAVPYTHSATLRSIQEIFGLQPFLGEAASSVDLADLFTSFP